MAGSPPELPKAVNDRLMTLRLPLDKNTYATIVTAYAQPYPATNRCKTPFLRRLTRGDKLYHTHPTDKIIIFGDFNVRVGGDHEVWWPVLGRFGRGNYNSNGELLLSLCKERDLVITNTFYQVPDKWFYSWQHQRSKRWHPLDYVLTRRRDLQDSCST